MNQGDNKIIQINLGQGNVGFAVKPKEDCPHIQLSQLQAVSTLAEQELQGLFKRKCEDCDEVNENWICFTCTKVYCSRFVNEHMVKHNEKTKHPNALSFSDLSLWCYECDSYISNQYIQQFQKFLSHIKFMNQDGDKDQDIKNMIEAISNLKISDSNQYTYSNFIDGLKSKKYKRICVLAGAGMSVAAGIPDFRSPGTGLYDKLKEYDLPFPEAIFDIGYYKKHPQAFYTLAKEFLLSMNAKPVLAHKFLKVLQDREQLLYVFTQNIDGLELDVGVKEDKVIQAHGHLRTAHCIDCKAEANMKDLTRYIERGDIYYCAKCTTGIVKPDVVFFGEGLPAQFFQTWGSLKQCDLAIVIGTSLKVMPFAMSTELVSKDTPIVILNRENVLPGRNKTLHLGGDIEPNIQKILEELNIK